MWLFKTKAGRGAQLSCLQSSVGGLGQGQHVGVDFEGSFAPATQMGSLRTLLAVATHQDIDMQGRQHGSGCDVGDLLIFYDAWRSYCWRYAYAILGW
jgi:hypothetical protein